MVQAVLTYIVVGLLCFCFPVFRKPFIKGTVGIPTFFRRLAFKSLCMAGFLLIYPICLLQEAYKWVLKRKGSKHADDSHTGLSHRDLIGAEGHLFCNQCGYIHLITTGKFDWKNHSYKSVYQSANTTLEIIHHSVRLTHTSVIYTEKERRQELICPSCYSNDLKYTPHYFT